MLGLRLAREMVPPLAMEQTPLQELGRLAGQRVLDLIDGRKPATLTEALPARLVRRGQPDPARTPKLLPQTKLTADCALKKQHVGTRERPDLIADPLLRNGADLICERLLRRRIDEHDGFRRIHAPAIRRERHNLHSVEQMIGEVIADNHRRSCLADFAPTTRVELNPEDITAFHGRASSGSASIHSRASRSRSLSAAIAR